MAPLNKRVISQCRGEIFIHSNLKFPFKISLFAGSSSLWSRETLVTTGNRPSEARKSLTAHWFQRSDTRTGQVVIQPSVFLSFACRINTSSALIGHLKGERCKHSTSLIVSTAVPVACKRPWRAQRRSFWPGGFNERSGWCVVRPNWTRTWAAGRCHWWGEADFQLGPEVDRSESYFCGPVMPLCTLSSPFSTTLERSPKGR